MFGVMGSLSRYRVPALERPSSELVMGGRYARYIHFIYASSSIRPLRDSDGGEFLRIHVPGPLEGDERAPGIYSSDERNNSTPYDPFLLW